MHAQTLTMSKLLLLLLLTISHLTQNIPTVSGHQVFLVDRAIRPLRRLLFVPAPETKVSNATMAVGMLATVGAANGSAAGRKVSNRMPEVFKLSRGGEVLREVVKAVV